MDFAAWFAAGANDALRVPVSRGELLVRIRSRRPNAGIRKPNAVAIVAKSTLPGIYSMRGLLRKLSKITTEGKFGHAGPHVAHDSD